MIVAIRVDSSICIGSGHVMRCLALAEQFKKSGVEVFFICSELTGNISDVIEKKGYFVERFPCIEVPLQADFWKLDLAFSQKIISSKKQVDWLIVDHYELDISWESGLRPYAKKIMVIDDLANRKHDCDLLLDQNFYSSMEKRYQGLVPHDCIQCLGPNYALLRPEFYEARKHLRERNGEVRRILLFFGGSDSTNETTTAIKAIMLLNRPDIAIDVVIGKMNPHKEHIKQLCNNLVDFTFHCQVDNMAQLIINADLAIGAGGTTTLERCFLGLPTLTIIIADNQKEMSEVMEKNGITEVVGCSGGVTASYLMKCIKKSLAQPEILRGMSKAAIQLFKSPKYRLIDYILGIS